MRNLSPEAQVEAILFAMGSSVKIEKIASAIERSVEETKQLLERMMKTYASSKRGIQIIALEDSYQLCSKEEAYGCLIRVAKQPKKNVMTDVLLETLAIVAYKQPVTRLEIEKIRGVSCNHVINKLMEYELIEEIGRLDAPGKPLLFGTTETFLRHFGISSLENLPTLEQDRMEQFKLEAEEEIPLTKPE